MKENGDFFSLALQRVDLSQDDCRVGCCALWRLLLWQLSSRVRVASVALLELDQRRLQISGPGESSIFNRQSPDKRNNRIRFRFSDGSIGSTFNRHLTNESIQSYSDPFFGSHYHSDPQQNVTFGTKLRITRFICDETQGFAVFFMSIVVTSDIICFLLVPVRWLFLVASSYVWLQYVINSGEIDKCSFPSRCFLNENAS